MQIVQDDTVAAEAPLEFAGEISTYAGVVKIPDTMSGETELVVLAMDAQNANFGRAKLTLNVRK